MNKYELYNNQRKRFAEIPPVTMPVEFYRKMADPNINLRPAPMPDMTRLVEFFTDEAVELAEAARNAESSIGTTDSMDARAHAAKEVGDVLFTLYAICAALGIDPEISLLNVAASNMTKEVASGEAIGKIQKGQNYFEPSMYDALIG